MCSGCAKKRQAMLDKIKQQQTPNQPLRPSSPVVTNPPVQKVIINETPEQTERRVIGME